MSTIATEPIGSIPRPAYLQKAMQAFDKGDIQADEMSDLFEKATKETIEALEASGSPVISDGEQSKPSFATYPIHGLDNLSGDGVVIPFADGHTRQLPKLTSGPFHYQNFASEYLKTAKRFTKLPVKQAVISASAISLLYPQEGIDGYSHEQFIADLIREAEADIRRCLDAGAYNVQIDFTEARLALKLDPSKGMLSSFIDLNNQVLARFTPEERSQIGVHTCPGGDHDSTHSADIPYSELLPLLFKLNAGNFYLEYAAEKDKKSVLQSIKEHISPNQRVFLGVTDVLNPRIETPQEICDLLVEASEYIPVAQLGSTDDCGFSPFADDISTAREIAFAKIKARVDGTKLAGQKI
ncbi:cobalamin-independent methionine synthase II family protein [Dyadobacter chenwenxiniae]|uniref:Cobalamin-independent methionine synthase II family protein n=1 Tax=Dyadobacter chenwenxiniae TaxID=2906456 RepID=A0A9X1PRH5_9BACT|nr:cobalamin-independent methionine synthase II family protein [Dyadobacter chenwenxiniae]MCF0065119.1 cobalamin-independent methionine synthase II family protein [Dyadobacter chenwenxiniae]UON84609.1 cobalamin-independent methionine synthase II family protein [Dyadobacter chenwenxiniae]